MKKSIFFMLLILDALAAQAQVGINTTTPNAQLEIQSTNQSAPANTDGIIIPKIDAFPVANPTVAQQGMLVYLTTTVGLNAPGFYYWDNTLTAWVSIKGTDGGTLDHAYDFGGAGNGRTITADAGAVLINGTDGFVSTGTLNSGAIAPSGAGTKMFWNPRKAAFRAGRTTFNQWDDSNIGENSAAFGESARASGLNSFAAGANTLAFGQNSTSFGINTSANGDNSFSCGLSTTANGSYSVVFGETSNVNGTASFSMGRFNSAVGEYSGTLGFQNSSSSFGEIVVGLGATTYTPSTNGATQFRTANATDRLFVVGNAIDSNNNNFIEASERSDAIVVLKNGSTGIGTSTPNAKLDINSVNNGILIPRVALTSAVVASPVVNPLGGNVQESTLVYNTATNGVSPDNVYPGYYYWNTSRWMRFDVDGENNPKYYSAVGTTNALSPVAGMSLMPEMEITLTPNNDVVFVNFSAAGAVTTGGCGQLALFFQIVLDGTPIKGWQTSIEDIINVSNRPIWDTAISCPLSVTAGTSHTIQVFWNLPGCNGASINLVASPLTISGSTFFAHRMLSVIDPNGGGGTSGTAVSTDFWSKTGNIGTNPSANFIGTTDAQPLVLRSNNIEGIRINTGGNVGINTTVPTSKLHVNGSVRFVDGTQGVGKVLTSDATGVGTWQNVSNSAWGLAGNSSINDAVNFIGSTNDADVIFKRNNIVSGKIGDTNTFFGSSSGSNTTTGINNTLIGNNSNVSVGTLSNATAIGNQSFVSNNNALVLGSINGVNGATASVNVGIGTSTPSRRLHVSNGTSAGVSNGNTGFLLESSTAVYQHFLTPSTSEKGILFGSEATSIEGGIIFNNSALANGIIFRTGGNTNRMVINNAGEVGIGTLVPSERLEVAVGNISVSSGDIYLGAANGVFNAGGGLMASTINYIGDTFTSPTIVNGDEDLYISGDLELGTQGYKPGGGVWATASDKRLKKNIEPFADGLETLLGINPVTFQYNTIFKTLDTGETYVGVIAQDIQKIAPYTVKEKYFGQQKKENENGEEQIEKQGMPYLTFDGSALTYILINSVKELNTKNKSLENEIVNLKSELNALQTLVQDLVAKIKK